jgi:hypothetical protein
VNADRLHQTKYRRPRGEWAYRLYVVAESGEYAVWREEVDSRRKPVNYRRVAVYSSLQEAIDCAEAN